MKKMKPIGKRGLTKKEFEKLREQGIIKKGTHWNTWKKHMHATKYGSYRY